MTTIDPSIHMAAMIRAQFATQFRAQARSPDSGVVASQGTNRRGALNASTWPVDGSGDETAADVQALSNARDTGLQQLVALRVRALSPDDPQRERKAFRLFLEAVLIQAFGRDRLDDRGWDQLVDTVLQRMEGNAELHATLQEAGGLLLSAAQQICSKSKAL